MNIIAQHGYKFTELPVHLIDLLNKFVSTEWIKTVKYCLEQHKLGLENILPSFKELVPEDVFECFRLSLMVHTGKKDIPDNEVERYIYALLDTSDTQHTHDRQKIQTQPTFRPAT
jgi:hypothetical protein